MGAKGIFASNRHENIAFNTETDLVRIERNAQLGDNLLLGVVLAVVEFRGDWPAICEVVAMRQWNHTAHPCYKCKIRKARMLTTVSGFTLDSGPADRWTDEDHQDEIRRCTITVPVPDIETQRIIHQSLRYKSRGLGRALIRNLPTLGLNRWDRLEPFHGLLDVSKFEEQVAPFVAQFWRCNAKTARVLHASPILEVEGLGLQHNAVDILHTWHLGPLGKYLAKTFYLHLNLSTFTNFDPFLDTADIRKINLIHLMAKMQKYYSRRRDTDVDWDKRGSEVDFLF